jgi:hypothetical protein
VYEGVGGQLQAALLPHLAPGGRLLQVGAGTPPRPHCCLGPRMGCCTAAADGVVMPLGLELVLCLLHHAYMLLALHSVPFIAAMHEHVLAT